MNDHHPLADPRVAQAVFFPRPDMPYGPADPAAVDHAVPLDGGIALRLREFPADEGAPAILFFHGNGETARDYDGMASAYRALPARLLVAEYRGYGPSGGTPSLTTFLDDAHATLDAVLARLPAGARPVVMGRSLGSAPAIELAARRNDEIGGLIVESGFARVVPLLELCGVPARQLGIEEHHGPDNERKLAAVTAPTLLIHAERDEIIPFADAERLDAASGDPDHTFVRVPHAGHNDIQLRAGPRYFEAIGGLLARARG